MKRKLLLAVATLTLLLCTACGREQITVEEAREVLPELVEQAALLNEIYFGEGFLPCDEAGSSEIGGYYYADSMACGFATIQEIREATERVFTKEYAAILYTAAFDGMHTDTAVVAPRYIEGELGILQSMQATVYVLPERVYDFDTLQILSGGEERTAVSVETVAEGESETVELLLVRIETAEGYEYRLDSPTY